MNTGSVITWIKQYVVFILGFAIIFLFVSYVALSPRGVQITNQFFDPIRSTDVRDEVVIVGIDDKSLQELGAWPWDRSIFAKLTNKLSDDRARGIVYDVLFLESRDGDTSFKKALLRAQSFVILGSKLENASYNQSFLTDSSNAFVSSALVNVEPDTDGKVRKYPPSSLEESLCIPPLAESAFNLFTYAKAGDCVKRNEEMFRYPSNVNIYSVTDILSDKISSEKIKGRVIFIGATSLDLLDHFTGISGEKIPGVYVHASIFTSLLNKVADRNSTTGEVLFLILFYIFITGLFVFRAKTILGQISVIIFIGTSVVIISLLAFSYGIIFPTPWLLVIIIITGGYITLYRFIKERKQNEYIQSLFSKYVHKDVLKELMKSSSSINFNGEKREITILFSDIRGFTSLSESLEPEELTKILNGYLSAMTPSILEEKGTIDKFIGDAIMAFWNAPLFVDNHTTHAVRAALGMQKALVEFNKKNNTELAAGIGLHVGNVIVGNVGSEERVNYTILGDAVNLASRIEGLTKKYAVACIVSEEVKEKVNDSTVLFRKLDIITVKGKNKPTTLYEIRTHDTKIKKLFLRYEEALEQYQKREFDRAESIFKELAQNGDVPSKLMLERIPFVRKETGWNGVWHWDEK